MKKYNSGFTIVEMAVVTFVIGMLIMGVLAGKNLIEGGKTRAVMTELDEYRQSMLQFQEKYFDWPGDISNASSLWAGAPNGNGDERIVWASEGAIAWRHLELAEMTGQTGFSNSVTANAVVGSTVPDSRIVGAGWFVDYSTEMRNHLGIGTQQDSGINDGPALEPRRAADIDDKIDDGAPTTGMAQSTGENSSEETNCYSGTTYSTANPNPTCTMRFTVK